MEPGTYNIKLGAAPDADVQITASPIINGEASYPAGRKNLNLTNEDLSTKTNKELKELCKQYGLKGSGTKAELCQRLEQASTANPIPKDQLSSRKDSDLAVSPQILVFTPDNWDERKKSLFRISIKMIFKQQ
ncbi:SAP domain-containing protein [Candidatus Synechococcus spongiarum]|uniref:SAP domain-containing protein n=1 Tax=Candidatus Synechococcus spongiarum TaxID=431041 RepID=UPI001F3D01D0|nr:SAP domain-containing protein [Candidatus Synechococcus spongiarum]